MMTRLMRMFVLLPCVVWALAGCGGDETAPPLVWPAANIAVSDSVAPADDHHVPFGSVQQGASSDQTVTVTNTGKKDLVLGAVAGANPLAAPFTITADTCSGQSIARGDSCMITLHFAPTGIGLYINGFDIPVDGPGAPVTVSVSGTGTSPDMPAPNISVTDSVDPNDDHQVLFGNVSQGNFSDQTVTVTNTGTADLVIGAVANANPVETPFSIPADTCSGQTIAPAGSCTVTIHFEPAAAGPFSGDFDIPGDVPDTPTVTVTMTGSGVSGAGGIQMGGAIQGNQPALANTVTTFAGVSLIGWADGTGTSAKFYDPSAVATDGTNLYVADTSNHTIRQIAIATGAVTTLAGTAGSAGTADGTGAAARFNQPYGIATDGTNLYVADTYNHTIRQIVISTGAVTTLAGAAGVPGSADGMGTAASFYWPFGVTVDGTDLYVADTYNHTIRKIVISTGEVTTLAGTAASAGTANGTGAAARFNGPTGITTDGTNLYVTDRFSNTIRKVVISTRAVTTLAGTASFLGGSADGTGAAARFMYPTGITTDGTNLYVADRANFTVRKIVISTRVVTTFAGTAGIPGSADGTGSAARFGNLFGITTDGTNLYVAEQTNNTIRQIAISTRAVTSIAGPAGSDGSADGTRGAARFNRPDSITTDGANLYVADRFNHTIRKIVISTGAVTTLAGTAGLSGSADGTGSAARFYYPSGITTDGTNLYVADSNNHTIRKIVISTGEVTTLAGTAGLYGSADGTGTAARFRSPEGITTDGTNLYVADTNNHTVRQIVISTGAVTTLAGTAFSSGSADGTGTAARFNYPSGITTDGTNVYVADTWNYTVRQIVISTGDVTTLAGTAGSSGSLDGTGSAARFNYPSGITTDGTNLYVADSSNHTIRKIVISTGDVTSLAGTAPLYGSADGMGADARFYYPSGITTDGISLYVTDYSNHSVRKIQ